MANTNYNPLMDGISEDELRHFLSIGGNSESEIDSIVDEFKSDRRFKLHQQAIDIHPGLPKCIATGTHLSSESCDICENYWTPERIEAVNQSNAIMDSI